MMSFDPKPYIIKIKGKDYLKAGPRIMWFRYENPTGNITTELISSDPFIFRAEVYDSDNTFLASGYGMAVDNGKQLWSGRGIEKAETAAIARALKHAGYGTEFAIDEYDNDKDHLADSPVAPPPPITPPKKKMSKSIGNDTQPTTTEWNEDIAQVTSFVNWCKDNMIGYEQIDMMQALNDALATPIENFISMKQYPGDKEHAMYAIVAYECGYQYSDETKNFGDAIKRIFPNHDADKFKEVYQAVKMVSDRVNDRTKF